MGMQFLKSQRVSPKDTIRLGFIRAENLPNLSYTMGHALPMFHDWFYNTSSARILNAQTLLLPSGSIYIITISLFIRSISGASSSDYKWITLQPYINGTLLYSSEPLNSTALMAAEFYPSDNPTNKTYIIDCTDGVSKEFQLRMVFANFTSGTFTLDRKTTTTVQQLT